MSIMKGRGAKRSRSNKKHTRGAGRVMPVAKGVILATIFTVLAMLLSALLLKMGILQEGALSFVSQAIKIAGIAIAAYLSTQSPAKYPWFRGAVAGAIYVVAGIIVFSIGVGSFSLSWSNALDVLMGAVIGALVATIFAVKSGETSQ